MSGVALYPWLKAAHVAAALLFVGGVLAASLVLSLLGAVPDRAATIAGALRRYDRAVTAPAMLLVWALGITLEIAGGWSHAGWLHLKLGLVVLLSAIHGVQASRLRRIAGGAPAAKARLLPAVLVCVVLIAVLAVAKP